MRGLEPPRLARNLKSSIRGKIQEKKKRENFVEVGGRKIKGGGGRKQC